MAPAREIAIHEAGHVVMARAVGAYVTHVEYAPTDGPAALARYHAGAYDTLPQSAWAAIAYAGPVAQRRVNPNCAARGEHDTDLGNFDACMRGASAAEREAVKAWTEATVTARWADVLHLAAELERRHGLYTEELKALGYWWPAPPRRSEALSRSMRG